jgi:hypothetical protein
MFNTCEGKSDLLFCYKAKVVPVAKYYLIAYQPHEVLLFLQYKKKNHTEFILY